MIIRKTTLIFWFLLQLLKFINCSEIPSKFVRRNESYFIAQSNDEIPKSLKEYLELNNTALVITGSAVNDTSVLITTLKKNEVKWTFCRDDSLQCINREQEFSVCYYNGDFETSEKEIDQECQGINMCKIEVKMSKRDSSLINGEFDTKTKDRCLMLHFYAALEDHHGHLNILNNTSETIGPSMDACKIFATQLPNTSPILYHTRIKVRQGKNNRGCNIKMSLYQTDLIIKGKLSFLTTTSTTKLPHSLYWFSKDSTKPKLFDDWKYLVIVPVVIFIIAIITVVIIKRKWLKKLFQKKKKGPSSTAVTTGVTTNRE